MMESSFDCRKSRPRLQEKKKFKTKNQDLNIFLSPSRGVAQPKSLEGPELQLKQILIIYNLHKRICSIEKHHEKRKLEKYTEMCRDTPIFG